ncbi:50S ribosomal protein L25/general stress protein Ctc [Bacillus massilinigeriensis]|uniref:50S ribosomal protein L25/general stress protein Ctc n=1 Tax=Bacillus massilionigeriensis TaxID=1805475 RepID=UPI00096B222D|nr:50S ribosomal protein L25/general stress protein Ctc [Bacillus massilionigeriensis]
MNALLHATERKGSRKSDLSNLRKLGNIPAVVYGSNLANKSVYINESDLIKTMRDVGRNGIIALEIDGDKHNVIVTDYQSDPIKREIIHIDFLAVDMSKEITTEVRIVLIGEAAGVKDGGVLQQPLFEISITAKPANIPPSIEVDVTNLQVNEVLTIADIKNYENIHINHESDEVIASILPPKQEEEINSGEKQESDPPENEEGRETKPSEES